MNQGNKGLNVVFRMIVFATFVAAVVGTIMIFVFAAMEEGNSYSSDIVSEASMISKSNMSYFIMTGLSVVSFVFSLICFKCTSTVASVFRSIFMFICAAGNIAFIGVVIDVWKTVGVYTGRTSWSTSVEAGLNVMSNDGAQDQYMFSIIFMFITTAVYFVLAITSIVSLVSKPHTANMGYQQNMPYGQPQMNQFGQNNAPFNAPFGQPAQPQANQFGQSNGAFGQPMQQAAPQQTAAPQATAPKIVGYDPQTGAPIYDNQQN